MAKTQTVYALISDGGDGSSSIHWFRSRDTVDEMLDEDNGHQHYWTNEGSPAATLTFPADFDLAAAGIRLRD
jgi:hypothetical protein